MSDDLMRKKHQLKTVKPILKDRQHEMDGLKRRLNEKKAALENSQEQYKNKLSHHDEVVEKIESIGKSEGVLDLISLNNARHYLSDVVQQVESAKESLEKHQKATDSVMQKLRDCHVDVRILEQYQFVKQGELSKLFEKIQSKEIEDLWLQGRHALKSKENKYE